MSFNNTRRNYGDVSAVIKIPNSGSGGVTGDSVAYDNDLHSYALLVIPATKRS